MAALEIDPAFAERNVNEGFSGGEKKRHEILQLALLKPKIAILDETDSGLDSTRSGGVRGYQPVPRAARPRGPADHPLHPDSAVREARPVHVFVAGRIVESGGPELADQLETDGYERFTGAGVGGPM